VRSNEGHRRLLDHIGAGCLRWVRPAAGPEAGDQRTARWHLLLFARTGDRPRAAALQVAARTGKDSVDMVRNVCSALGRQANRLKGFLDCPHRKDPRAPCAHIGQWTLRSPPYGKAVVSAQALPIYG